MISLLGLDLTDHVKMHVRQFFSLGSGLLLAVFRNIGDAQLRKQSDVPCGVEFGDGQKLRCLAPGRFGKTLDIGTGTFESSAKFVESVLLSHVVILPAKSRPLGVL